MTEQFDPDLFPGSVSFYPPGSTVDTHGGAVLSSAPSGAARTLRCYVEYAGLSRRDEAQYVPTGRKTRQVYTPSDPGVAVDWLAVWQSRLLRVLGPSTNHDGWALWLTECEEVT